MAIVPPSLEQRRAAAVAWFAVQGGLGLAWWALLWGWPAVRPWFTPSSWPDAILLAFWLPDLTLFALGSLLVSIGSWRRAGWVVPLQWAVTGATAYAALYTVAAWLWTGQAWLAPAVMIPCAAVSFLVAWSNRGAEALFVESSSESAWVNAAKTLGQTLVFWLLFLGFGPAVLLEVSALIGVPQRVVPGQVALGMVVFFSAMLLSVGSGLTMAVVGRGTPLPLDTASRLVVAGPFRYLRNPMAVSGLAQGLGLAIGFGDPLLVLYVLAGGVLWDQFVRPIEEADLRVRFGADYEAYVSEVRCWIPRLSPYSADKI